MTQTELTQIDADDADDEPLDFTTALTRLRAQYDDSYGARVEAAAEIRRAADHTPQALGGEAVMQPLLRYQQIDADGVKHQISQKHDEDLCDEIVTAVIEYAETLPQSDAE